MNIHITLLYAAILGIMFFILSIRVIKHRFITKVILGDGGHHNLNVAIRTHANFSEYIPLNLILMMGVELLGYPSLLIHGFGVLLVIARLSHIVGLKTKGSVGAGRPIGVIVTLSLMAISSVLILVRSI